MLFAKARLPADIDRAHPVSREPRRGNRRLSQMTRYLPTSGQQWHPIEVRALALQACPLWEGDHNVESGLYRLPQGLTIPPHHHPYWC